MEKNEVEIEKLKILNDIYRNENEQLKVENQILFEEFSKYKEKINKNIIVRIARKLKRIAKKF